MAQIPLSACTPTQLDYALAVALKRFHDVKIELGPNGPICAVAHDKQQGRGRAAHLLPYWFRPSQYWGHGGPLIQEFKLPVNHSVKDPLRYAMENLLVSLTDHYGAVIPDNFLNL